MSMHHVGVERQPPVAIVQATGELDAFAAPDLSSAFAQIRGETRVLADLCRVSFMDSTALGLIVRAVRELGESGVELRVVLPGGSARRIFEITALDRILPVAETRVAALADLAD
jgi:anti-sigma B factor antagonist